MGLAVLFAALLVTAVVLTLLGLAAERRPDVARMMTRIAPLTPPQRGRLGVWVARDARFPPGLRLLPLTAFVYQVAPLDFIPDFLPRIGKFDDRVVLALGLGAVLSGRRVEAFEEHLGRIEWLRDVELERASHAEPGDVPVDLHEPPGGPGPPR